MEERSHVQRGEGQAMRERLREAIRMDLVSEDSWPYCEQVYERVKQVKALEEQEEFLVLQLEEIRNEKRNVQENTRAILAQMLSLPQG
jgi:hypothetical protein